MSETNVSANSTGCLPRSRQFFHVPGERLIAGLLVPEAARYAFGAPWIAALIMQPINALAFGTDGVHWGTADFKFLRDATTAATMLGVAVLYAWSWFYGLTILSIWACLYKCLTKTIPSIN